ncbi:hypothetical protein V8C40DRAFT_225062 [Trichoderma camerunense]
MTKAFYFASTGGYTKLKANKMEDAWMSVRAVLVLNAAFCFLTSDSLFNTERIGNLSASAQPVYGDWIRPACNSHDSFN